MRKKSRYRCRSLYESFVSRGPFAITNGWHALKNSFLPPSIQRLDERRRSRCPQSPQFSALCRLNGACTWGKSLFGDSWLDRGGGEAADRAVVRWSSAIIRKNRKFFALEEAIWNRGPALCLTHPFLCASMCHEIALSSFLFFFFFSYSIDSKGLFCYQGRRSFFSAWILSNRDRALLIRLISKIWTFFFLFSFSFFPEFYLFIILLLLFYLL